MADQGSSSPMGAWLDVVPGLVGTSDLTGGSVSMTFGLPVFGTAQPSSVATGAVTYYVMAAYNTVASATEYWVAVGAPNSSNPSGQATLAGSLRIHAKYTL